MVGVTGASMTTGGVANRLLSALAVGLLVSPAPTDAQQATQLPSGINELTEAERQAGWELLFDGHSTRGWRGYMMDAVPDGWQARNGELIRVGRGRDLVTVEQFANFELTLEWKVETGGNSGVFFRAIEGLEQIYYGAPEMQILDDDNHPDGRSTLTSAGSNYAIHPAPRGVVRRVGEWNTARILVNGDHVEHWMNGVLVVEYELGSADWSRRVASSKFTAWPEYGQASVGHIGLQEHGDPVAFRNIKIRRLP